MYICKQDYTRAGTHTCVHQAHVYSILPHCVIITHTQVTDKYTMLNSTMAIIKAIKVYHFQYDTHLNHELIAVIKKTSGLKMTYLGVYDREGNVSVI